MSSRPATSLSHDTLSTSPWNHAASSQARSRPRSVGIWWHLLSLDAPTVAVVWCWFFGGVFHVKFPWETLPTIALGTWCVYVADRLLDGWRSTDLATLRDRHWFYLRHRKVFVASWILAAMPLAYLIFFRIDPGVRTDDIVLCLIGVAYFILIHGDSSFLKFQGFVAWFPKELAVGFLFAIATAVPTWVRLESSANVSMPSRAIFIASVFIFGMVCWLNCVAIQTWEDKEANHEVVHAILAASRSSRSMPGSRKLTHSLEKRLAILAVTIAILSIGAALAFANHGLYPIFISVAISAGIFVTLIYFSRRFSALSLRIAADAALLTPLLFLVAIR